MKKGFSIILSLMLLTATFHVTIATHYCGGNVAATKVSLTGELATCGMEHPSDNKSTQESISRLCCEDDTSSYSIDKNYIPAFFNVEQPVHQVIQLITVPVDPAVSQATDLNTSKNIIRPPGDYLHNSTDQPVLCIFRI